MGEWGGDGGGDYLIGGREGVRGVKVDGNDLKCMVFFFFSTRMKFFASEKRRCVSFKQGGVCSLRCRCCCCCCRRWSCRRRPAWAAAAAEEAPSSTEREEHEEREER